MVTVSNYAVRETKDGRTFISLELNGGLELVQSMETGRFYGTSRKTSLPCTFTEEVAKSLIGSSIPGSIQRVACEPYQYVIRETGEEITLNYQYQYVPEQKTNVHHQHLVEQ